MSRFILFAPNVGVGGGLVLLKAILDAWPLKQPIIAILDERARSVFEAHDLVSSFHWFRSSISGRVRAEIALSRLSTAHDTILCFHNLPPILRNRGTVTCYVQTPNLVGLVPASDLSPWVRVRTAAERFIFRVFRRAVDTFIVQTPTMAAALRRVLGRSAVPVLILPFVDPQRLFDHSRFASTTSASRRRFDFLYVSDGAAHKNHANLFRAFELLALDGVFPSLALTLHPVRDAALRAEMDRVVQENGLDIVDLGQMPHEQLLTMYGNARALLFASYAESFGIPLLEASAVNLPIIAAERDFVRDICEPAETFDPLSPRSIARSVRRFLGHSFDQVVVLTPEEFVAAVWSLDGLDKDD